ncbi:MAG TPA: PD-(D/E)XK nuclease family protein, partial [Dissulfurispiraceae bacterium]|nr:PD-(D/E)XK nuclease family protein [Dissulfurispiraceae bacterium]
RAGGSVVPPVIVSMDEFVDMLYSLTVDAGRISLEPIDAVAILHGIHRSSPRPLAGGDFLELERFFPVGLTLFRDLEELHIEGIEPARVREIEALTDEAVPDASRDRLQSISSFYERFYREMEEGGFSTRSLRYRVVAARFDAEWISSFDHVIVAGFYALTAAERLLFTRMRESGLCTFAFHSGRGLRERLGEWVEDLDDWQDEIDGPHVAVYRSPDTHGQVLALAAILSEKRGKGDFDEKTVVVLPSSNTLFPLMRLGLSALGDDEYNVSLGYPLARTPLFTFLSLLMELINSMDGERVYIPAYLRFVLHPYTKNIRGRMSSEGTRVMFHAIEGKMTSVRTRTFCTLAEIEDDREVLDDVFLKASSDCPGCSVESIRDHLREIHRNTVGRFLAFNSVRDFSDKVRETLEYLYENSTARLHPYFYPYSVAFMQALDDLSRSLLGACSLSDRSSYYLLFRKYVSTCRVPFEGTPLRGLQVLGLLETRSVRFDCVFVLDVNEDTLPDTRKMDTVLPNRAREILGLPTYRDRDRLASYYFETLVSGAREVHLFYVENDGKERSRFVERLLWQSERERGLRNGKDPARSIVYRISLGQKEPGDVGKCGGMLEFLRSFAFTATSLDTYLVCSLRFYYRYVLNLSEKEEVSSEIERADVGKAVHSSLARFFSGRLGRRLGPGDIDAQEMNCVVERLFENRYGRDLCGADYLLKKQVQAHLADLLTNYYLPLVTGGELSVTAVEQTVNVTKRGFRLSGRPDSIEKRGEETVIIDYKTGGRPERLMIRNQKLDPLRRDTWSKAIGSLQLPFYVLLHKESTGSGIESLNGLFLLLGRSAIDRRIELPLFRDSDRRADLFDRLASVIFGLLNEIQDPATPFSAAREKKEACPGCAFAALCGTQWVAR